MAQVVVLRPGYAYTDSKGRFHAGATVSLVIASDVRLLVDNGGPPERALTSLCLATATGLPSAPLVSEWAV